MFQYGVLCMVEEPILYHRFADSIAQICTADLQICIVDSKSCTADCKSYTADLQIRWICEFCTVDLQVLYSQLTNSEYVVHGGFAVFLPQGGGGPLHG